MKSWKRLIACIKKDFSLVQRALIPFCLIYIALSVLYYAGIYQISQSMAAKPILMIPFFAVLIVFSIALLANQYWFQKAYSKKIGVPANTEKFVTMLSRGIKIYVLQFLIFLGVAIVLVALFVFVECLVKVHGSFFQLLIPIVTIALIVFGVIWFYRLLFVNSILMYSRLNAKSRAIIQESKYLVRQNFGVVLTMIAVCLIAILPPVLSNLGKQAASKPNLITSVLSSVLGLINTYFFVVITVNAVIEHKYFFLLSSKKENE